MKRYVENAISDDLSSKIILLSGSRQTGKTTLAKQLCQQANYFNYDSEDDRLVLDELSWDRKTDLRTKEGKEIDFLLSKDGSVTHLIEVKTKDDKPSPILNITRNSFKMLSECNW